jgi:hypothetical protein
MKTYEITVKQFRTSTVEIRAASEREACEKVLSMPSVDFADFGWSAFELEIEQCDEF